MRVYKERQYLVFDFEDGKTVKYDFAKKIAIGKKGKPVKNLCSQLSGMTVQDLIECCEDKQYAKFLQFIQKKYRLPIQNIGTILSKVPDYHRYEQIFSAGFEDICGSFRGTVGDIPKGLIKLCKTRHIQLSDNLVEYYKENPNAYNIPYQMEFISLTDRTIYDALVKSVSEKEYYGTHYWEYRYNNYGAINVLISKYGYTAKALFNYLDYLMTYEAIDSPSTILGELHDYACMMQEVSPRFDKYPRHFLTTHKIACRNYNRLKHQFDEERFCQRIDKSMEKSFGNYTFLYPESTQAIKDEAVSQNNCVASYIDKVIDGGCHILFLRHKDKPNESLVTIEVRDGKIVQARQRFNDPVTAEQQEVIDKWNKWYSNKQKQESEEQKHD